MLRLELVGPVALCHEPDRFGLATDDLCHDTDWEVPQLLASAVLARGVEAMIVPSATRLGNNLVVFPTRLRPGSQIVEVSHLDPRLYVDRS